MNFVSSIVARKTGVAELIAVKHSVVEVKEAVTCSNSAETITKYFTPLIDFRTAVGYLKADLGSKNLKLGVTARRTDYFVVNFKILEAEPVCLAKVMPPSFAFSNLPK